MARLARLAGDGLNDVLDALERDGLAHRAGGRLHLGPAERAVTIEA